MWKAIAWVWNNYWSKIRSTLNQWVNIAARMRTIKYFKNHTIVVIFMVWCVKAIIAERLECYMCSEISPNLRCSINKTATRKAEDDVEYRCRIWALNGVAVNKDLVPKSLCTEKVLSNQMSNFFNNQFSGPGPAQALCCSWSKCNANIRLAGKY